jgi:hypothetical protein
MYRDERDICIGKAFYVAEGADPPDGFYVDICIFICTSMQLETYIVMFCIHIGMYVLYIHTYVHNIKYFVKRRVCKLPMYCSES